MSRVLRCKPGQPAELIEVEKRINIWEELVGGKPCIIKMTHDWACICRHDAAGEPLNAVIGGLNLYGTCVMVHDKPPYSFTEDEGDMLREVLDTLRQDHGLLK